MFLYLILEMNYEAGFFALQKKAMEKLSKNCLVISENEEFRCPICLTSDRVQVVVTSNCNHYFHQSCILEWLNENFNCPMCRQTLSATIRTKLEQQKVENLQEKYNAFYENLTKNI